MSAAPVIRFHVDPLFREELERLPWSVPLAEWPQYGVRTLPIKKGVSRHTVLFVNTGRFSFGIKEITEEVSQREVTLYEQMLLRGIHTLVPAGYVVREEPPIAIATPVGIHYEPHHVSHTVTVLVTKVLPDSLLYSRNFRRENRERIWDAIALLFAQLHAHGIYWGDASLANVLIRFEKRDLPFVGPHTTLAAYLADAETVEMHRTLSRSMREADLGFFFESMEWINEDLRSSGILREEGSTESDRTYLHARYETLYASEMMKKAFEEQTTFNIDRLLGGTSDPNHVDLFLKHVEEHRWYLGERSGTDVTLADATKDWYDTVFAPMCSLFRAEGIPELFHGKTAAELYVDIMNNKYYLSERAGRDIGMAAAMQDYAIRFGADSRQRTFIDNIVAQVHRFFEGDGPSRR